MKKRGLPVAMALLLVFWGTGCLWMLESVMGGGSSSAVQQSEPAPSLAVSSSPEPSVSLPAPVPASSSAQPEKMSYWGVFRSTSTNSNLEYRPRFVLREDGTFAGVANLLEAMGFCEGTYTVEGSTVNVHITEADFFLPGQANSHDQGWNMGAEYATLEILDENTIRIVEPRSFLGNTDVGEMFERTNDTDVQPVDTGRASGDSATTGIVIADGGLNLRDGPGTGYASLALIPDGETIEILQVEGTDAPMEDWLYVRWNGTTGWVNRNYVILPGDI